MNRNHKILNALLWSVAISGMVTFTLFRNRMNTGVSLLVFWHTVVGLAILIPFWKMLSKAFRRVAVDSDNRKSNIVSFSKRSVFASTVMLGLTGVVKVLLAASGLAYEKQFTGLHLVFAGIFALFATVPVVARAMSKGSYSRTAILAAASLLSTAALGYVAYSSESIYTALTSTNAMQSGNPNFPAGTILADNVNLGKSSAVTCGGSSCHQTEVDHWSRSKHHHAISLEHVGEADKKWCAGCHAPGSVTNTADKSSQTEAVNCLSCHAMHDVPDTLGNGRAVFEKPEDYPFAGSLQAFSIRLRKSPHRESLRSSAHASDRNMTCAPCHQMSVTVAQNGYKHIPDDTTWNEWQQSRYSTNSLEPEPIKGRQDCMSCHMGKRDGIAQHESLSAGPAAFQISAALLTQSSTGNKQIDWMKPDTENNVFAHLGSKVNVDLLLTADRIGHAFPTVSHSRDVTQIEFSVIHGNSYPLTGFLHELGMIGITGDGEYAYCENFTKLVTPILRRQISPEAGDVVHLQFDVKEVKRFKITLSAELVRNIDGQRHVLAAFNTVLQSTTKATAQPNSPNPDRLYQYGLALLKQGDRTRARQMFKQCVALKPLERKYKTASVNAAIANGDFLEARRDVEKLLKETPNDPMARFQMGAVLRQMGQFQEALNWLTPLVDQHSGNRELLLNIGLCQLQLGKNEECEETFKQMCGVNPADATAHYNLMQVYLRQKKVSVARREEAIFRSLQEETPLQSIREPFLAAHPNIAEELKPNHVHLYPLTNWGQH